MYDNNSNLLYHIESGALVGGATMKMYGSNSSGIFISPGYVNADPVTFKAIVGHELIHAIHISSISNYIWNYSEYVAYNYTQTVFNQAGEHAYAMGALITKFTLGYDIIPSVEYFSILPDNLFWFAK